MDSAVHGNDFELIPTTRMERGHSVEGSFSREFSSIYIVMELWPSEVGSHSRHHRKTCILGKTTPCGKILKILFRKDSPPRRSTSCVQISWNLTNQKSVKSCIIYQTKESARSLALASARITPKICHGQQQTMYSQCPKFHPNRLTSGGVIAECVNTVQTRHKVFPIFSEASASSLSN